MWLSFRNAGKAKSGIFTTQIDNIVVGFWSGGGCPLGRQPKTMFPVDKDKPFQRQCMEGPSVSLKAVFSFIFKSDYRESVMNQTQHPTGKLGAFPNL